MRTFVQYLMAFCCRSEEASDIISSLFETPIILDKYVKYRAPRLNRSREIPPEAVGGDIFDSSFRYNFRPKADNDVISGVAVDYMRMDVYAKLGDSR